jgi:hypothetical protein
MAWLSLSLTLALRALLNPALAVDLLRVAWRFRHRHWFRRFPFLPLPAQSYVRWRMYTAYGDEGAIPPAEDVIESVVLLSNRQRAKAVTIRLESQNGSWRATNIGFL